MAFDRTLSSDLCQTVVKRAYVALRFERISPIRATSRGSTALEEARPKTLEIYYGW
jgi:hypothetical protein